MLVVVVAGVWVLLYTTGTTLVVALLTGVVAVVEVAGVVEGVVVVVVVVVMFITFVAVGVELGATGRTTVGSAE